nr:MULTISPECIES: hypothetical protein [unclassified Ochrobactrum]
MRHRLLFGLFVAAWTAIIIYIFAPGYIYADSYDQYQQALNGTFSDWHPPIMSAFWRFQILLLHTGSAFFAINVITLYFSFYLLLSPYKAHVSIPTFVVLALCPVFFGLISVVWKDVFLACLVLLAVSIAFNRLIEKGKIETTYKVFCLSILLVASLTRANAPFITAPIILIIALGWDSFLKSWVAAAFLSIALIAVSGPINHRILMAESANPLVSLEVYDLAGISHFSGTVALPGQYSTDENKRIVEGCYSPVHWDVYAWGDCGFVVEKLNRDGLSAIWIRAIANNPVAYLKHRLSHFNDLLRFLGQKPAYKYYVTVPPGYQSDSPQKVNAVHNRYSAIMDQYDRQPWHYGFVWYALSIGLFIATIYGKSLAGKFVNCLAFASFTYISAYLVVGVAADFRYLLPAIYILVGASIIFAGFSRDTIQSKQGVIGLASMLAIIGVGVIL